MPIIKPRAGLGTLQSGRFGGIDDETRLKVALHVLGNIAAYEPKTAPMRPFELTQIEDGALRDLMVKSERQQKMTKADHTTMVLFSTWKCAVRKVEAASVGDLILLLGVLNTFEAQEKQAEADQVRAFVAKHYRANLPGPPAPSSATAWGEGWAMRHAQQRAILPLALRGTGETKIKPVRRDPFESRESEEDENGEF
jgi:hypothetical protein